MPAVNHCGTGRHLRHGLKPAQVGSSAGRIARPVCGRTGLLWHSGFALDTWPALAVDWAAVVGTSACWLPLHHYHGHYEENKNQVEYVIAVVPAGILLNII